MKLNESDIEEIEYLIPKIESSFQIEFAENDFMEVKTFGDFCDVIENRISHKDVDNCTSQQAFYKLRKIITEHIGIRKENINPRSELNTLFPKKDRISKIRKIEKDLEFKLDVLGATDFVNQTFMFLFLTSLIGIFFSWKLGLFGAGISIFGIWIANKIGRTFRLKTVGDLTKKMLNENYLKSRRNPKTVNKQEIQNIIAELFSDCLDIEKSKFTREVELF